MRWVADLLDDTRHALRTLRNSRTLAFATVLTLAIGIGVNTAVFSVVNALLFRPLPVSGSERLVVLSSRLPATTTLRPMSFPTSRTTGPRPARCWKTSRDTAWGSWASRRQHARPSRVLVTWVTGNYFELLGVQPALGRLFETPEGTSGRVDPVVVLGHTTWRQRFNGDPSIVGQSVRLNGRPVHDHRRRPAAVFRHVRLF